MKTLQTSAAAVGLAFLLCVALIPGLATGAPESKTNNIVFVDNVNGNDANPGTAAQPKATIQAGENRAEELYGENGAVVVRGGGPPYDEGIISVSSGMKFYGNGVGSKGLKGHGIAPPPVLNGGFDANAIASITVQGFEIVGVGGISPVTLQNVGDAVIIDNYMHDLSSYGIIIVTWDANVSSVYLDSNQIISTQGGSIIVSSLNESRLTLAASNNNISDTIAFTSGFGGTLDSMDSSEMYAAFYGNKVDGFSVSIAATSHQDSLLRFVAGGNSITKPTSSGMALQSLENSRQEAELTKNDFDSGAIGAFYAYSDGDSTFNLVAKANVANGDITVGAGVGVVAIQTSEMNATFEDNRIQGGLGGGNDNEAVLNFAATENEITGLEGFTGQGLGLFGLGNGVINGTLSKNRILGVGGDGILLLDGGTSTVAVAALDGNVITGADGDGIHLEFTNPANSVNGTKNNVVHDSGGNSLEVVNEPVSGQIRLNGAVISPLVDTP